MTARPSVASLPFDPLPDQPNGRESNVAEFTVSELSSAIKRTVEGRFGYVKLRGEISGYRGPHSSGHCYFSLKDKRARIDAVIWKGVFARLKFKPEEGLEVVATGKVSTFAGKSSYQIIIDGLEPAGAGALMALLEERKRKLAAEGLFDEERKQKLPFLPRVIGIVTSPTGAVIRDMMHGFRERFPAHVIVWPVRVQGETSGDEVAAAIRGFNAIAPGGAIPRPDVLIVARGGGSLEDLWGFNDEAVVRAAAASTIPLISAVGHETDWTLIDLAADARAPTPTKAAEWAVPKMSELLQRIEELSRRLHIAQRRGLEQRRARLTAAARGLPRSSDLLALPRQRFDAAATRLSLALKAYTQHQRGRFQDQAMRLRPTTLRQRLDQAKAGLEASSVRLDLALKSLTRSKRAGFQEVAVRLQPTALRQRLQQHRKVLQEQSARATRALMTQIAHRRQQLESQGKLLETLSHKSVLQRGFALVRDQQGKMLRRADAIAPGQSLQLEFADGTVKAQAEAEGKGGKSAAKSTPNRAVKTQRGRFDPGGQGSLF